MPQTKPVEKPVTTQEQILKLIGGIQDLHDLCLMYVGIFCGPRASEDEPHSSPDALMFPTFGCGERKGQAVPRWGEELPPLAGSPDRREVMRRTLGTNLQHHGTLKVAQGTLRHASIKTTGDVYVQTIETSVLNALTSRTMEILADWKPAIPDGKVTAINGATPKRRTVEIETQLDQVGPGMEGRVAVNA